MNRKIIAFIITVVALSIIIGVITYIFSFRTITFSVMKENLSLNVYHTSDRDHKNKISEVRDRDTLRLQEGSYQAVPTDPNYDNVPLYFNVEKSDKTIALTPSYSQTRLDSLLSEELQTIQSLLTSTYPQINAEFELAKGKLYREGQWYTTTLTQKPENRGDIGDIYHVILHKKDGQWLVIHKPTLVLTTAELGSVPIDILQDANRMGD